MGRKFKCRNGTILEEFNVTYGMVYTDAGYQSDYKVLYDPTGYFNKGEHVHLVCMGELLFPKGYSYGKGYDIVEELKPRKQKKQTVSGIKRYYYDRIPEYNSVVQADESKLLKLDLDDPNMVELPNGVKYYCPPGQRMMLIEALLRTSPYKWELQITL